MGISNVAVKTFDSSGAQSLCRTNEYKGDEEVKSSFISKCQKMYISGSGETPRCKFISISNIIH